VALDASIADNLAVDRYNRPPFTRRGMLSPRAIQTQAVTLMQQFDIRAAGAMRRCARSPAATCRR
jgi:ABC-type uncharacterized transport system ATPase subunit